MITAINKSITAKREQLGKDDKGFTLIELLVVVLIIGVLAAIAIPAFLTQQAGARDSAVRSDIGNAKTAVIAALVENSNAFPALDALEDFTPNADSNLTMTGNRDAFCITGSSEGNGANATNFAATDESGTDEGTCAADGSFVAG